MLTLPVIILRLALAAFFCGIIGLERELHGKPVGFRTAGIVGLGSALMTMSGIYFFNLFPNSPTDPLRIASIVASGIGFIGAGVIIQSRGSVYGLTTAASLWLAAGLGIAFGVGFYVPAIFAALITLTILWALYLMDKKFLHAHKKQHPEQLSEEEKNKKTPR